MGRRTILRKKKITQPDEFITTSERVFQFVRDDPARFGVIIGIAVLILVIILGSWQYISLSRKKLFALGGEVTDIYQSVKDGSGEISEAINKLEDIYRRHTRSNVGQTALYQTANLYFIDGDYQKAKENYLTIIDKHSGNALLYPLSLLNLAYCYEQLKNYQEAVGALEKLMSSESGLPKAQIYFDLGRIYHKLGNEEKSRSSYQEILDSYPDSPWADVVREKWNLPPEKEEGA